jgi:flagellar basal body-associated protein FliL
MGSGGSERRRESVESVKIEAPSRKSMREMKTRAGLILCYIAIGLVGLVSLTVIMYFFFATHSLKPPEQPLTQESIQVYKEARSAVIEDVLKISDRILGNVLLPVLTLLLGYMFGSREEKAEAEKGD